MEILPFKMRIKDEYQCIRIQKIILSNGYTWIDETTNIFIPDTIYDFNFNVPKTEGIIEKKLSLIVFEDKYDECESDEISYNEFIKRYSNKLILFGK